MDKAERGALLAQAKVFFCDGMARGYAGGAEATPIRGNIEWKEFTYRDRDWLLQDKYYVDPVTAKSVGETRIYFEGRLIWVMYYGGFYVKSATPLLKSALLKSYQDGVFHAGRGVPGTRTPEYTYGISVEEKSDFSHFVAREWITRHYIHGLEKKIANAGSHNIFGMALI